MIRALLLRMLCRCEFGWPRRIGDTDVQTCVKCGCKRVSPLQFEVRT